MNLTDQERQTLIRSITVDPHIDIEQKEKLLDAITAQNSFYHSLFNGALGSGIGYSISKFLKLSKSGQILVTMAGFGIGKYLLDNHNNSDKFMEYNKQLKGYKLNV